MNEYRIVDLRRNSIDPEPMIIKAHSPEHAANLAFGLDFVRSGSKDKLCARVYFQNPGQPMSMVRLYAKVGDQGQGAKVQEEVDIDRSRTTGSL